MTKTEADLTALAAKIYDKIKLSADKIGKTQGLRGLGIIIPAVLSAVEEIRKNAYPLPGAEKKEIAIRVLNRLINPVFPDRHIFLLPIIPAGIEEKIFEMAVEWFVNFFNHSFGKGWLAKVKVLVKEKTLFLIFEAGQTEALKAKEILLKHCSKYARIYIAPEVSENENILPKENYEWKE